MSTSRAKRIGSLLFCPACGTLLDLPRDDQDEIECHQCGRKEPASCECLNNLSSCKHGLPRGGRGCSGASKQLFQRLAEAALESLGLMSEKLRHQQRCRACSDTIMKCDTDTAAYENLPTKTYSSPNAFPSALRSKRALVQNTMTGDEAAVDRDPVVSTRWSVRARPFEWQPQQLGRGDILSCRGRND